MNLKPLGDRVVVQPKEEDESRTPSGLVIPDTAKEYDMTEEEAIEKIILDRQPSKEFATVEQLGGLAVYLCSDSAAQITGATLSMDGGWTAL